MSLMLTKEKTADIVGKYAKGPKDTGSSAVQVALLTERIRSTSEHMKANKKDFASQRGLLQMVSDRKSHLTYVKKHEPAQYEKLLKQLDLRK
jgi:small subunit ribosomal protein S15